jgi:hypothetical protein
LGGRFRAGWQAAASGVGWTLDIGRTLRRGPLHVGGTLSAASARRGALTEAVGFESGNGKQEAGAGEGEEVDAVVAHGY